MTTEEAWEQVRIARAMAKPYCFALVSAQVLDTLLAERAAKEQGELADEA